jgi:hypothetical protein
MDTCTHRADLVMSVTEMSLYDFPSILAPRLPQLHRSLRQIADQRRIGLVQDRFLTRTRATSVRTVTQQDVRDLRYRNHKQPIVTTIDSIASSPCISSARCSD